MHFFLKKRQMRRWRVRIFHFIFVTLPRHIHCNFCWGFAASFSLMSRCFGCYGHENSSFAHVFKHCGLKTSDWNANNSTICASCAFTSMLSSIGSDRGRFTPYQSLFGTEQRPPHQLGLGSVVWCTPESDCCIHTCPKDLHQKGKQIRVCFNWTKQDRCEYTLKCTNSYTFIYNIKQNI